MTKTSKLFEYWGENLGRIQELYPGTQFPYLENVFIESKLSLEDFIKEIDLGKPLDYISKTRHFAGYDFYVDERVLIPRYETELLFEMTLNELKSYETPVKLAEVGVGSGCLGLSILASLKREINFLATDISSKALDVFRINYKELRPQFLVEHDVKIKEADRLTGITEKFQVIISNPPYIKTNADKEKVHETTLKYEPHLALFIEDLTYEQWFSSFFEQVWDCLVVGGCFMMEGHEDHLQDQAGQLDHNKWSHIEVRPDLTGRDRFLVLRK